MLKPRCPWCGASTSAVYRSRQDLTQGDNYGRHRQCAECGGDWPTEERLDREKFARQLARQGKTLADLGLAPGRSTKVHLAPPAGQERHVSWAEWFWSR